MLMGYCGEDEIAISTDLKKGTKLWKFTLLHEMCHLKHGVTAGHGPKFEAEMLRLARAGAFEGLW